MDFGGLGRVLIVLGLAIVVLGAVLVAGGLLGLGHLPGDLSLRRGNLRVYAPIASCIVLSVVLTVVVHLLRR